jgi:pyrroloquinoline-quinone synthase
MNQGLLAPHQVRGWIVNRFYYQQNIPVKDAIIVSKLPSREDRRRWLTRIVDHDGREGDEGGIEAWLRLGEAAGIPRAQMFSTDAVEPGARAAVDSYVDFCRDRPWPEAVASSLTELFAPALVQSRLTAIQEHYPWVKPEGLGYFRNRLVQAPRDVEHGLQLVLEQARTREDQDRAVAALTFKCGILWALLDAIEKAYPDEPGSATDAPTGASRPRLARHAVLRRDDVRGLDLILLPERVVKLTPTAAEVIRLCDGGRTVDAIIIELQAKYVGPGLAADVVALIGRLAEQRVLE